MSGKRRAGFNGKYYSILIDSSGAFLEENKDTWSERHDRAFNCGNYHLDKIVAQAKMETAAAALGINKVEKWSGL